MIKYLPGFSLLLLAPHSALALQAMDDSALSAIAGQDGLTIRMEGDMSATAIQATMDAGTASEATVSANTVTFNGVNVDGTLAGAPSPGLEFTLDSDADEFAVGLDTLSRVRLRTDSLTLPGTQPNAANSFGTWAFDFDASVRLVNQGFFSMSNTNAYLFGEIADGDLFYRQGSDANAWMGMHDFLLRWEIPSGTLGICQDGSIANGCNGVGGIVHRAGTPRVAGEAQQIAPTASSIINLALDFEYIYGKKNDADADEFKVTSDARGVMHFGWLGSIKDAEVKWMAGGSSREADIATGPSGDYYDAYATTTQGMRFSSQWDYVDTAEASALGDTEKEFRWRLGETADVASADQSRINFELGDWTIWGTRTASKPAAHYFPLIAVDAIKGGQGPGGLCWGYSDNLVNCGGASSPGAQFIDTRPGYISSVYGAGLSATGDASSLAIIVRDGQLQSYSRKVRLLERDAGGNESVTREFDWGLIYALANIDANIYLYPGGSASAGQSNNGVIADIMVMSQTFGTTDDPETPSVNETYTQGFNWDHGTHLMIADTEAEMGLGFMSSSFLVAGNDTRIWVRNQALPGTYDSNGDGVVTVGVDNDYYSGGIDFFSPEARFNYRATFGGGILPGNIYYGQAGRPQTVRGTLIDINLEGMVNLRFSPSDPTEANNRDGSRNFLGYSGALRLGSNASTACGPTEDCGLATNNGFGTYISLAEPGRPDVDVRFANITGDLAFTEGQVDLALAGEAVGNGGAVIDRPRMRISNIVHVGYDAANRMNEALEGTTFVGSGGQPVIIDRVMLGQAELGSIVIPSARIYSSITLEPQTP